MGHTINLFRSLSKTSLIGKDYVEGNYEAIKASFNGSQTVQSPLHNYSNSYFFGLTNSLLKYN